MRRDNDKAAPWKKPRLVAVVSAVPFPATMTSNEIARRFEATRQGVLWVVTGMVKDELLELIDNPDHKRAKLVRFTSRGQKVFKEVQTRQITWVNRLASSFTLGEIRKSIDLLERVAHEAAE